MTVKYTSVYMYFIHSQHNFFLILSLLTLQKLFFFNIFTKRNLSISGSVQFKPILFKHCQYIAIRLSNKVIIMSNVSGI